MATTVSQLLALLKRELTGQPVNTELFLREAIPRALVQLSGIRTWFNEADFSFALTANDREYSTETGGFPKDAARLDFVNALISGCYSRVEPASQLVEVYPDGQRITQGTPQKWYWKPLSATGGAGSLILWPAPHAAGTLTGRYLRDARRDVATGNIIDFTVGSEGYSNPWFDEGQEALVGWILKQWYSHIHLDAERATANFRRYRDALDSYTRLRDSHRGGLGQVAPYWTP